MLEAMDFAEQTIMHYAAKLGNIAVGNGSRISTDAANYSIHTY